MSHNNGLIQADVDLIGDVKAVLGVNSDDQSVLCTYAGMNIWAKYKPVKWLGDVRSSTWWQAYNQRCGINIGYAGDLVQLIQQWLQVSGYSWQGFWQYDAIADPYPTRLMDFNGYQHGNVDSMQPWDSYTFPNEITRYYEEGDYTFSALGSLSKRSIDTNLLTLADIKVPYGAGYLDLGSMYFGIAIVKQNGSNYEYAFQTSYYDFATDVSQLPEPHMDGSYGLRLRQTPYLTKYTLPSLGNYLIFPFLSRDRLWDNGIYTGNVESNPIFLYPRQSFPGLFVPLFHSGKAVTMVDQPVYVELTLTAAKRSNSYGVDLTLVAHNTMSVARELPEGYLTYSFIVYPQLANGSYDYQNGRTYTAVWGTGTPSIAAGGSITLTTYVEFTNYGVIGGYISNIHVSSSYGWITRNVTAPSITYGGFATGIKIVDAGGMEISTLIIERTHTSRVYYKLIPSDAYGGASWSSSNPAIATVNAGTIQTLRTGTCTIYCAYSENNTIYASLSLTVTPLHVTGIDITTWYTNMVVGQTYQWAAAVVPSNADDQGIIWSSGNTSVATVDQNGVVTPVGAGGTYITATSHDGGYQASVNVAVTVPVVMTGIRITGAPASLAIGSSMILNCYADYSDGTSVDISSSVTWNYDNTIFSQTGTRTFQAIRTGGGAISAEYRSFTDSVYVSTTAQLTGVSISPTSQSVQVGSSFNVYVYATYWDGTSYTTQDVTSSVTWTKPSFLSRSGNTFTATSSGSGSIKASFGGYSPTCSVTVSVPSTQSVDILDSYGDVVTGDIIDMVVSDTIQLTAYSDGTITSVNWSSSAVGVARVTGSTSTTCTIGARSAGTANITLKLNGDNNLTATVTIRVSNQPI